MVKSGLFLVNLQLWMKNLAKIISVLFDISFFLSPFFLKTHNFTML